MPLKQGVLLDGSGLFGLFGGFAPGRRPATWQYAKSRSMSQPGRDVKQMTSAQKIYSLLSPAERKSALVLLFLMIVGMALETIGVGLVIPLIMLITKPDNFPGYPAMQGFLKTFGNPTQVQLVTGGMLALVGIYFVKTTFLAFLSWRQMRFAFGVQVEVSQKLFATYLGQPYTFHLQRNSAHLIRNVIGEVNEFTFSLMIPGMLLITETLVIFGLSCMMIAVEPVGALFVMSVLGGAAWVFQRGARARVAHWGEMRQIHEGLRIQHLQQGLGGAKDVILLGRVDDFLEQYRLNNTKSAKVGRNIATLQQLPRLWLEFLTVSGIALLVIVMVFQGREMAAIMPTLGLFAVAAFRLMPSVNRVLGSVQAMRYGLPVINTLYMELGLGVPSSKNREGGRSAFQNEICLTNITYTYPGSSTASVEGLSLTIRKGESVGFVGPSGSGKSTLVDVVLGLLTPGSGHVAVDGHNIQENLRHWQNQIGYVAQSIYLTDDTLRRNVAFGLPDGQIDDLAVARAIKDAQLEEFVESLPGKLETIVGERGVRLSGGQRQRIGIARALYHDPSVLVLDEATSALDTDTEEGVMQAVAALRGNKTLLIVAHRLTTLKGCDLIFSMEKGKLVSSGGYKELVATPIADVSNGRA